jgi:hypothetical protein
MAAKKGLYSALPGAKNPKGFGKKNARNTTSNLEMLQKIKESSCAKHGCPKRTQDGYACYVA